MVVTFSYPAQGACLPLVELMVFQHEYNEKEKGNIQLLTSKIVF